MRSLLPPLSVALLAGCASGVLQEIPAKGTADAQRPVVYLAVEPESHAAFSAALESTTKQSALFGEFSSDESNATRADYTIKLGFRIRRQRITESETVWTLTSLFALFTVVPSTCASWEYSLSADVLDRAGSRLKSYELTDSARSWLWLYHATDCGKEPTEETVGKIASSMVQRLYRQMSEDGTLEGRGARHRSHQTEPLVYVSAPRAQRIIETQTKVKAPFRRFTFDKTLEPDADFVIQLNFQNYTEPTNLGKILGRGMLAIMSLGTVSFCTPTVITLNAKVLDRQRTQIGSYTFSDSVRTHMSEICSAEDEDSRPEVFTSLVRRLYEQMARERIFASAPGISGND